MVARSNQGRSQGRAAWGRVGMLPGLQWEEGRRGWQGFEEVIVVGDRGA